MEIKIKKGTDLPLAGAIADGAAATAVPVRSRLVAVVPDDFYGPVLKVDVRPGQAVKAGTPLLHSKQNAALKVVSPADGVIADVVRGERRKVLRVVIDTEGKAAADTAAPEENAPSGAEEKTATPEALQLARHGLMALMRQRPYDIVPDPAVMPRDIFVTAFDSAPLAPLWQFGAGDKAVFDAAVGLLKKCTRGDVYISRRGSEQMPDVKGAVMVDVKGPHPAGLAGVQIANIKPVNKGEVVWTLDAWTLLKIGQLALGEPVSWEYQVAVTGSCLEKPYLAKCLAGTAIEALVKGAGLTKDAAEHHRRYISGNVLTGVAVGEDGFLRRPYTQVTVIPEGDDRDEFMGWASMSPKLMSLSPSFPGHFFKRLFSPDARVRGGRRAMIMSGLYENLFPMDVMPEYLLKAIQSGNIDDMERLGIYEVAPEDFALPEYADSSKLPLQAMVRKGLDLMRKESE